MEVVVSDTHDLVREWLSIVGPEGKNPDCQSTPVREDTSIWSDIYVDLDYQSAWLLEVQTHKPTPSGKRISVVDYLYVFRSSGDLEVEWLNDPRLFFDRDSDYHADVYAWFIGLLTDKTYFVDDPSTHTYNEKVRQADRDAAAEIGLVLPTHGTPSKYQQAIDAAMKARAKGSTLT